MEYRLPVYNPKKPGAAFSMTGLALFVILASATVLQAAAAAIIKSAVPHWEQRSWYIWFVTFLPLYAAAVPAGYFIFRRIPHRVPTAQKKRFGDLIIYLLMCISIMYIGNILGILVNTLIERVGGVSAENPLESYVGNEGANSLFLSFLFMVILAPVIEEFIFRKLIIDRLGVYGEGASILVSALAFALFHGNFYQFFYAFGLGAMFAFLYLRTGRLRYPVILHMFINLTGGIVGPSLLRLIDLDGIAGAKVNNAEEAIAFIREELPKIMALGMYSLMMIGFAIAGLVLLIVRRKTFTLISAENQLEKGTAFRTIFLNIGMILFILLSCALTAFVLLKT